MLRAFIAAFLGIVVLLAPTSPNAGLDEGLVFYLTFDNVKNQTIIDESGNGLDAEIHKHTETVKGKYGDAMRFTKEGLNCVNIPSQEKLKITGEITMMVWVYYPETWRGKKFHWIDKGCHSDAGWDNSYGIDGADLGNGPEIGLFLGSQNNLRVLRQEFMAPHEMEEKKWHHVAGSYDGKFMKIYVNGEVIGEEERKFNLAGNNNSDVRIGCAEQVPHLTFLNGSIDDAAVWQRALSDDEIKQAMAGNLLAVSPKNKIATTWANIKRRQ